MGDLESDIVTHEDSPPLPGTRRRRRLRLFPFINRQTYPTHERGNWLSQLRSWLQRLLASKWGHYSVLVLVILDICCIFATFLLELHLCEHDHDEGFNAETWGQAIEALAHVSLAFSSLFMAELLARLIAFGPSYFKSWFHTLDAIVIIGAFVIELAITDPMDQAGSLIIVIRLWRVFKIVGELSSEAEGEITALREQIEKLKHKNEEILKENHDLRSRVQATSSANSIGNHDHSHDSSH